MENKKKLNPVVHFEMPYSDRDRMADFYTEVFGWNMQKFGEEMGHYVVAQTAETDEKGMIQRPGAINGGFYPSQPGRQAQPPSVVIAVEDIQAAVQAITDAGGEVLGEPTDIPGVGQYVSFTDTEGNRASILQPVEM